MLWILTHLIYLTIAVSSVHWTNSFPLSGPCLLSVKRRGCKEIPKGLSRTHSVCGSGGFTIAVSFGPAWTQAATHPTPKVKQKTPPTLLLLAECWLTKNITGWELLVRQSRDNSSPGQGDLYRAFPACQHREGTVTRRRFPSLVSGGAFYAGKDALTRTA